MYILFDIGATNIRFARSTDLLSFEEPVIIKNTRRYEEDIVNIKAVVEDLSKGHKIKGIAGGVAGTFDKEKGVLLRAPNMKTWVNKPLAYDLQRMTGIKAHIINDADLAGIGEANFGSGRGFNAVAYMTVSTGVGGSLIIDGKPLGVKYSPEPGWQIINSDTKESLHELIAGRDLELKYGISPKDLPSEIYQEVSQNLAIGIYNAMLFWSPDVFVLGGSQMKDISIEDLNSYIEAINDNDIQVCKIVLSNLGSNNGLYGAMALFSH